MAKLARINAPLVHVAYSDMEAFYEAIRDGELDVSKLATKLDRWGRKRRYAEKPYCVLPFPGPDGGRSRWLIWLTIFSKIRSPTYINLEAGLGSLKNFDEKYKARVRKHLEHLIALHEERPVLGKQWTAYLKRALALLPEPVSEEEEKSGYFF